MELNMKNKSGIMPRLILLNTFQGLQILQIWSILLQVISTDSSEVIEEVTLTPEIWQENQRTRETCVSFLS